jgi:hypothetical protein
MRGTITARPPGGVPGVVHRRDTPSVAAPRKSAPTGSETDRGATQEGYVPARSVSRCSVERASVALGCARPCRSGADDDGRYPEQGEDEQVGHMGLLVCGHHTRSETPTQETDR